MTPLTEHEKKQLRLLEAQLHAEDPKFVKNMRTKHSISVWQRPEARKPLLAMIGLGIGFVGIIAGIFITPFLGVNDAGLITTGSTVLVLAILVGCWDDLSSVRKAKTQRFMTNLELRWDERKRNNR